MSLLENSWDLGILRDSLLAGRTNTFFFLVIRLKYKSKRFKTIIPQPLTLIAQEEHISGVECSGIYPVTCRNNQEFPRCALLEGKFFSSVTPHLHRLLSKTERARKGNRRNLGGDGENI